MHVWPGLMRVCACTCVHRVCVVVLGIGRCCVENFRASTSGCCVGCCVLRIVFFSVRTCMCCFCVWRSLLRLGVESTENVHKSLVPRQSPHHFNHSPAACRTASRTSAGGGSTSCWSSSARRTPHVTKHWSPLKLGTWLRRSSRSKRVSWRVFAALPWQLSLPSGCVQACRRWLRHVCPSRARLLCVVGCCGPVRRVT